MLDDRPSDFLKKEWECKKQKTQNTKHIEKPAFFLATVPEIS